MRGTIVIPLSCSSAVPTHRDKVLGRTAGHGTCQIAGLNGTEHRGVVAMDRPSAVIKQWLPSCLQDWQLTAGPLTTSSSTSGTLRRIDSRGSVRESARHIGPVRREIKSMCTGRTTRM